MHLHKNNLKIQQCTLYLYAPIKMAAIATALQWPKRDMILPFSFLGWVIILKMPRNYAQQIFSISTGIFVTILSQNYKYQHTFELLSHLKLPRKSCFLTTNFQNKTGIHKSYACIFKFREHDLQYKLLQKEKWIFRSVNIKIS